jgi:Lrp/AsnC family leucine-responsive transcriptional regulator
VKVVGATDLETVFADLRKLPEVTEAFTIAGDTDAPVRFRVKSVLRLQRFLKLMRKSGTIASTKTMIIIGEMHR